MYPLLTCQYMDTVDNQLCIEVLAPESKVLYIKPKGPYRVYNKYIYIYIILY